MSGCEWNGCDSTARIKGLCGRHYNRQWAALNVVTDRARWSSVFADVDEIVVERLVAGDLSVTFTSYERREAVRRLVAAGMPKNQIGRHLGMKSARQVYRDLRVAS